MTRLHWFVWLLGLLTTSALILAVVFGKAMPEWYTAVILVAAALSVLAATAAFILQRTQFRIPNRDAWLEALSTYRVGFLATIAITVVLAALLLLRPWR